MKKVWCLFAASLLAVALLSGCSGSPSEEESGGGAAASQKQTTTTSAASTTAATTTTQEETAPTTEATEPSALNSDLTFVNSIGAWLETADGYQILADDTKAFWSLSDTSIGAGQAFTYEADVTVNDPLENAQVVLYVGAASDEHVKNGAYELRLGFKDNLMRIFYTGPETRRYGEVVNFTDEQMSESSFHIKMEMSADNQVTYYWNDEQIAVVSVDDYAGGYLGVGSYGTNATFQNISVTQQ